ncbi:MAG: bifunctional DNA primase/polymerase [Alphaproteobacteria bacterium]|nr:bifunctional DNA primase/polymerase [Alphaproteobacteria bacterium]
MKGNNKNRLLLAALEYATLGYRVFPLHGIKNGRCDCKNYQCKSPGKHPIGSVVPHGDKNATNNVKKIRKWWNKYPNANIGLVVDGFFVIDVDGEKGRLSLRRIGSLSRTSKARTGRGEHIFFKGNLEGKMMKLEGIDIKTNGYMVVPPSVHASSRRYRWIVPLSKMIFPTEGLVKILTTSNLEISSSSIGIFKKSSRNNTLTSIAGFLRNQGLEKETIASCLMKINRNACRPPLDESEVEQVAMSISRYEPSDKKYFDKMSNVVASKVDFLFDPYLPLGCISIIDGDPGVGKSYLTANLAAALTTGNSWAGIYPKRSQRVLFMSVEDDPDKVLLPRLIRHKADISKIDYMSSAFSLDRVGVDRLRRFVGQNNYGLIIIDPVTAFMPAGSDMYRANEVRGFLMPLAEMAREFNVSVLLIRHLRKADTESAIHRGIGSIDFIATVRSAMIFAKSPDDPDERILAHAKASYTASGSSQIFLMMSKKGRIARLKWRGKSSIDANNLLRAQSNVPEKLDGAVEFLKQILAGEPVSASIIKAQAEARSFSESTMKRARKFLHVKTTKGPGAKLFLPKK